MPQAHQAQSAEVEATAEHPCIVHQAAVRCFEARIPPCGAPNHSKAQDVIDDLPLFCFGVLLDPHKTGRHRYHPMLAF